ncbi:MAG TPA: site-specific integrase [Terracidiphilus sp.]
MKSPTVRLYIRIRRADGDYAYADPVWNRNRTLRAGYAILNGRPEAHPEGTYYLRFLRGKKRVWQSVGSESDAVLAALRNKEHDLQAIALGRSAPEPASVDKTGVTVAEGAAKYLTDIRRFRSPKTIAACERILGLFEETFAVRSLASLRRDDLLDHMAALRQKGLAPRTVYNHIMRIKGFLRAQGVIGLFKTEDIPAYDEPEVEAYDADQLDSLFLAADPEEQFIFEFFLATGFRDQEVRYCTWRNVDFKGKVISVRSKPELGFRPKDKEERSVPVPDTLIAALAARKPSSQSPYLFPTSKGEPDGHYLRRLQKLAHRAGLNCGECVNKKKKTCREHPICSRWGLHKFRRTYATMHCEAGVPVTTIQRWLGHSDLATTLRYLAIADLRSEKTRQQVNATFAVLRTARSLKSSPASHASSEEATPLSAAN